MGRVMISACIEQAIGNAVARRLEAELQDRALLLAAKDFTIATAEVTNAGARLFKSMLDRCYPDTTLAHPNIAVEFGDRRTKARLEAALAFGAVTARVLAPRRHSPDIELLCALFNLSVGLVDGICDSDVDIGCVLLDILQDADLLDVAKHARAGGWLRGTLPAALAAEPTAIFTADVLETFFQALHDIGPDDAWRHNVGVQLDQALQAERGSIRPHSDFTVGQLLQYSRLTSVLPFEIIENLTGITRPRQTPSRSAKALGEAMWRIDDLVDLCQDAGSGALNSVLLASGGNISPETLAQLESSGIIERVAKQAAEDLQVGLQHAEDPALFLYFVHQYTGIPPRGAS